MGLNLRERAAAKREILQLLDEYDGLLQSLLADAPMTYAPSHDRTAKARRYNDSVNQSRQASQLGLERAELRIGRCRYRLNPTPIAHQNIRKALSKLPVRVFDRYEYHFVDTPQAVA